MGERKCFESVVTVNLLRFCHNLKASSPMNDKKGKFFELFNNYYRMKLCKSLVKLNYFENLHHKNTFDIFNK